MIHSEGVSMFDFEATLLPQDQRLQKRHARCKRTSLDLSFREQVNIYCSSSTKLV